MNAPSEKRRYFATPSSAAMLCAVFSVGLSLSPYIFNLWKSPTSPFDNLYQLVLPYPQAALLCIPAAFCQRDPRKLFWVGLWALAAGSILNIPILLMMYAWVARSIFIYEHITLINGVFISVGVSVIGLAQARLYGLPKITKKCAVLGFVGSLPYLAFRAFWALKQYEEAEMMALEVGFEFLSDTLTVLLPALIIEHELQRQAATKAASVNAQPVAAAGTNSQA